MAWTGNFLDQVSALTNGIPDETQAQQWTLDGCYNVIEKAIKKSGADEVWKFVIKSGDIAVAATDVDEIRTVAAVIRFEKLALKGQWQLAVKYKDSGSIYKSTVEHPVWWISDSELNIHPAPTVAEVANYFFIPEYSITTWGSNTSAIPNYPSEYYYHAMLYTAIQVLHSKMIRKTMPELPAFIAIAVAPPTIPSPTLTSPTVNSIDAPDITGETPVYMGQSIGGSALGDLASQSISDLAIPFTAPSIPSIDTIVYTPVSVFDMESIDAIQVNDIASVSNVVASSVDSSIFNANAPTYADKSPPIAPSIATELAQMKVFVNDDEDPEMSRAKAEEIQSILSSFPLELQTFQAQVTDAKNTYDEENVEYQAKLQEAMQNVQNDNQVVLQNMQTDLTIAQANFNKELDIAKADSSNEVARKQANLQQKQAALMQDAVQSVQETVANNNAKMSLHQQEMAAYTSQVDSMVKEYQQNVQKITQLWQTTNSTILQEHDARVKDELNKFNADNAKYQAHVQSVLSKHQGDLQKAAKEADFELQKDIQNYQLALEKWQKDISVYSESVNASIGEYTQNLQKYQAEIGKPPVEYQWLQDQWNRLKMEYEQLFGAAQAAPATQ